MNKLEDLAELIERQYQNIVKSRYRPRSAEGIITKKRLLQDFLEEYEDILNSFENTASTRIWNKLTDNYEFVRTRVENSITILNGSSVIQKQEKRRRHNSDYIVEIVIPENNQVNFFDENTSILSSTILDESNNEGVNKSFEENLSNLKTQFLHNSFNFKQDITDFKQDRKSIKEAFINDSIKLNESIANLFGDQDKIENMAFPKAEAIQCIPDFNGSKDELDAFIYQIEHFVVLIPEGANHDELIYVVLLKLKGKAAAAIRRIKAATWPEVKANLMKEFGDLTPVEAVLEKIETLRQGPNESFHKYKIRVLGLKSDLQSYNDNDGQNCKAMDKNLRLHCIGGLRNRQLVQMAQGQREKSLEELMDYLEEQSAECEKIAGINERLRNLERLDTRQQGPSQGDNNWFAKRSSNQQSNNGGNKQTYNGGPSRQFNSPPPRNNMAGWRYRNNNNTYVPQNNQRFGGDNRSNNQTYQGWNGHSNINNNGNLQGGNQRNFNNIRNPTGNQWSPNRNSNQERQAHEYQQNRNNPNPGFQRNNNFGSPRNQGFQTKN